jgi:hypothetical protein
VKGAPVITYVIDHPLLGLVLGLIIVLASAAVPLIRRL